MRLNLLKTIKDSSVEITDKWPRFEQRPDKDTHELITVPSLPTTRLVKIAASFDRQTNVRCDIDNLLKMALDTLQTAGILHNDDQVRELTAKVNKGAPEGSFTLTINFLE